MQRDSGYHSQEALDISRSHSQEQARETGETGEYLCSSVLISPVGSWYEGTARVAAASIIPIEARRQDRRWTSGGLRYSMEPTRRAVQIDPAIVLRSE